MLHFLIYKLPLILSTSRSLSLSKRAFNWDYFHSPYLPSVSKHSSKLDQQQQLQTTLPTRLVELAAGIEGDLWRELSLWRDRIWYCFFLLWGDDCSSILLFSLKFIYFRVEGLRYLIIGRSQLLRTNTGLIARGFCSDVLLDMGFSANGPDCFLRFRIDLVGMGRLPPCAQGPQWVVSASYSQLAKSAQRGSLNYLEGARPPYKILTFGLALFLTALTSSQVASAPDIRLQNPAMQKQT